MIKKIICEIEKRKHEILPGGESNPGLLRVDMTSKDDNHYTTKDY